MVAPPRYVRGSMPNQLTPYHATLEQALKTDAHRIKFASFEELNAWLGQRCQALWGELHHPEYPALSVADVLEQEQSQMMPMPTAFDGYVEKAARVSSTCLVTVSRNRYSVPCEFPGQMVSTHLYPGWVCVVAGDAVVASHERIAGAKRGAHWRARHRQDPP